jgi:hypothetical protein
LAFFYRYGDNDYVCYYRLPGPKQPTDHLPAYEDAPRRSLFRATSKDGSIWEKDPSMLLTADERDHRDTQYQECVPIKVDGGYFALITMYHPITQTLNLRMAASRDGKQWWFPDRVPCLDNAPMGDYGGGMTANKNLFIQDGKLYVHTAELRDPPAGFGYIAVTKIGLQETVVTTERISFLQLCALSASWDADHWTLISSAVGQPGHGQYRLPS